MRDLVLITAHCDSPEKEEILRGLVNDFQEVREEFDLMVVSHTVIPVDVARKTDYSLYDKKNELLYDWDMRSKPWFSPDNVREILSIFTGSFNTHLAVWRLVILGNSLARGLGYAKVHHLEYDVRIGSFKELRENSRLLESHDAVLYTLQPGETVDPIVFGSYQAYRTDSLDPLLYELSEEAIKDMIRESNVKSPEQMFDALVSRDRAVLRKKADPLLADNGFMLSHRLNTRVDTAWCLPYYDRLSDRLCFIVWNSEQGQGSLEVRVVYNNEKVYHYRVEPGEWHLTDIDAYENAKELLVILNDRVRNRFRFDDYREEFKEVSFRRAESDRG